MYDETLAQSQDKRHYWHLIHKICNLYYEGLAIGFVGNHGARLRSMGMDEQAIRDELMATLSEKGFGTTIISHAMPADVDFSEIFETCHAHPTNKEAAKKIFDECWRKAKEILDNAIMNYPGLLLNPEDFPVETKEGPLEIGGLKYDETLAEANEKLEYWEKVEQARDKYVEDEVWKFVKTGKQHLGFQEKDEETIRNTLLASLCRKGYRRDIVNQEIPVSEDEWRKIEKAHPIDKEYRRLKKEEHWQQAKVMVKNADEMLNEFWGKKPSSE